MSNKKAEFQLLFLLLRYFRLNQHWHSQTLILYLQSTSEKASIHCKTTLRPQRLIFERKCPTVQSNTTVQHLQQHLNQPHHNY